MPFLYIIQNQFVMKKILIIGGVLAVVAAAVGYFLYNKPHQDMRSAKAAHTLTAQELFEAYESDESAADQVYLGKVVRVNGTVLESKKDEDGKTSITLEGGGAMFGVMCKLDDFSQPKRTDFAPGEQVTFQCECTGMLMDVVLVRCVEL